MKTLGSIVKDSKRDLYCIAVDDTAFDAACYMAERNIGAVTVIDGERIAGLFSERGGVVASGDLRLSANRTCCAHYANITLRG